MKVRAYNLVPGAGFRLEGDLFGRVVRKITRDVDIEIVSGRDHNGRPFAFDFNDYVEVVGLDANLGSEPDEDTPGSIDLGVDDEDEPSVIDAREAAEMLDATHEAAIDALAALGYGSYDLEHNERVMQLHRVMIEAIGLEDLQTIIAPPAHG